MRPGQGFAIWQGFALGQDFAIWQGFAIWQRCEAECLWGALYVVVIVVVRVCGEVDFEASAG